MGAQGLRGVACLVFAARSRSRLSRVRGPVLLPPCIRQRPFRMAGERHGQPARGWAL